MDMPKMDFTRTKSKGQISALLPLVIIFLLVGILIVVSGKVWEVVDGTVDDGGATESIAENISKNVGTGLNTFGEFYEVIIVLGIVGILVALFLGRGGIVTTAGGGGI